MGEKRMKVKLLIGRAGPGFSQAPGEVVEVGKAEALRMIERGSAEPAGPARESAAGGPAETAARGKASARKRNRKKPKGAAS